MNEKDNYEEFLKSLQENIRNLTTTECLGSNRLEIFKKMGVIATPTDFAILSGAFVSEICYTKYGIILENRASPYFIQSHHDNIMCVVDCDGCDSYNLVNSRDGCARPALPFSLIKPFTSNKVIRSDGVLEVDFGKYLQRVSITRVQYDLNNALKKGTITLKRIGYIKDSRKWYEDDKPFFTELLGCEYQGKNYALVEADSFWGLHELSNGKRYKNGDYVWIEVSPVVWLVDKEKDIAISRDLLISGVRYVDLDDFMKTYFLKSLISREEFDKYRQPGCTKAHPRKKVRKK